MSWHYRDQVESDWIDYNGHLNVAYYTLLFDRALDAALDALDLGAEYRRRHNCSVFVAEAHTVYDREVGGREAVDIATHLISFDAKRAAFFHEMSIAGSHTGGAGGIATQEVLCLHVDLASRRVRPWGEGTEAKLAAAAAAPSTRAGRGILLRRRPG